jgi:NAD(P)-dependent dehydrogenase (short-subunit alcohol dehydrogenase family)
VRGFTDLLDGGVDIFVNNAGALTQNRSDTVDGFEMTIGTNHLGAFALTNLLFPRVRSQIVNVGSDAHESAKLRLDDMHLRTNKWTVIGAYGRSKLAVMLWGLELDRRLRAAKSPVVTQLTHPGWVASNLSHVSDKPLMALAHRVVSVAANALANDIEQGAAPTLYCISEPIPPGRASPYSGGGRVRLKSDHREAPCRGGRSRSRSIGPAVHRRPRCSGSKPTARAGRTGQGP